MLYSIPNYYQLTNFTPCCFKILTKMRKIYFTFEVLYYMMKNQNMPNPDNHIHRTLCNKSNFERLYISQYIMLLGWMSTVYIVRVIRWKLIYECVILGVSFHSPFNVTWHFHFNACVNIIWNGAFHFQCHWNW